MANKTSRVFLEKENMEQRCVQYQGCYDILDLVSKKDPSIKVKHYQNIIMRVL
jgi:hypothetical protein